MDFAPLIEASLPVQLHIATIVPAFLVGTWLIFFSRKGSRWHRAAGTAFVVLMVSTSLAAVFVSSQVWPLVRVAGPAFGPIHLLVLYTLFGTWRSVEALRRGTHRAHGEGMCRLYFLAILLAGAFTFAPGRLMYRMFFG